MTPFTQYKPWMIQRYGKPLFRVPVQLASGCPHGKCTFCPEDGSRAQQIKKQDDPFEQIEVAIRFSKNRYKAQKLCLYIQAFTADLTRPDQQQIITDCLDKYCFDAISIGTRPDCLGNKALDFLKSLTEKTEVWVEPGIQTVNDRTLETINRGHDWECSRRAVLSLSELGVCVAPHIILGLPGETSDDWNRTAVQLADLPISGIKIHNLHIVKGTRLAQEFKRTPFPLLNHWEYAEGLIEFLRRIPPEIPIMRISTDTPPDQLIAPEWHLEKGQFLDYIIQQMTLREIKQGDLTNKLLENRKAVCPDDPEPHLLTTPVSTADGSITFFSEDWKEHYHTKAGARLEAEKKFIEPSGLKQRLETDDVQILDLCFGLGNNSLAALRKAVHSEHAVHITALEMDRRIIRAASERFKTLDSDPVNWKNVLKKLLNDGTAAIHKSSISLSLGDARYLIQKIPDDSIDLIYHDPFSTQHCPELWTVDFFNQLRRVLKSDGALLTYSSAAPVHGAMEEAGFLFAETEPGHQMGKGTIAGLQKQTLDGLMLITELPVRRSTPYRDTYLCGTAKSILRQRQNAVEITKR